MKLHMEDTCVNQVNHHALHSPLGLCFHLLLAQCHDTKLCAFMISAAVQCLRVDPLCPGLV